MTSMKQSEFDLLQKEFNSMGNMVHEALTTASSATMNSDTTHIDELIQNDKLIDGRENTIDQHCIRLWATQAPVAKELRELFAIIRSTNELERIGDHAKHIARSIKTAVQHAPLYIDPAITQACSDAPDLLDQALRAQQTQDSQLAHDICATCKACKKSLKELNTSYAAVFALNQHPTIVLLESLAIGHDFQRIFALIANICKNTVYMLDGELIRHKGRENPIS